MIILFVVFAYVKENRWASYRNVAISMRYVWIVTIIFRIRNVLYAWNLFYLIRKIPSDLETKKYLEAVFNLEIKAGNPDPHMKFLYDQLTVLKDLPTIFKE